MRFAQNTLVSVDKSKAEIEAILSRYGADQFISGWDQEAAYIGFRIQKRMIKLSISLPSKNDKAFTMTPTGRHKRHPDDVLKAWEQACRQRWRALALVIKAKLEAVECGITSIEDEFLSHIILPDGRTAGAYLIPEIAKAYESGKMPALIPFKTGKGG